MILEMCRYLFHSFVIPAFFIVIPAKAGIHPDMLVRFNFL